MNREDLEEDLMSATKRNPYEIVQPYQLGDKKFSKPMDADYARECVAEFIAYICEDDFSDSNVRHRLKNFIAKIVENRVEEIGYDDPVQDKYDRADYEYQLRKDQALERE
jgi:hypothetical protein